MLQSFSNFVQCALEGKQRSPRGSRSKQSQFQFLLSKIHPNYNKFKMSKSKKKKKKDVDFQKIKLKVGRKIKRDTNETKAEFKTRKIVLKEVKSYSDDPITALVRHSDHISQQGKVNMLGHFNSFLSRDANTSLTKPIIDGLAKFIIDNNYQVRSITYKCLKSCFNHLKRNQLPLMDFMKSLQPYLNCAYTHVTRQISKDCHSFLEYLLKVNEPQTFETMMAIMLPRYEAANLFDEEKEFAKLLKQQYLRHKQKSSLEEMLSSDKIEPLVWPQVLNLDCHLHVQKDDDREVLLVSIQKEEDVAKTFLETLEKHSEFELVTEQIPKKENKRRKIL